MLALFFLRKAADGRLMRAMECWEELVQNDRVAKDEELAQPRKDELTVPLHLRGTEIMHAVAHCVQDGAARRRVDNFRPA
eukprot:scaffold10326_cov31-Tisochrysis_lutea.AAC.5